MNKRHKPNNKKAVRASRFEQLRQGAATNSSANDLTEEEAVALIESIRQEIFEEQKKSEGKT
jgi:hypothetical protein